jgi:hypothetical protein
MHLVAREVAGFKSVRLEAFQIFAERLTDQRRASDASASGGSIGRAE